MTTSMRLSRNASRSLLLACLVASALIPACGEDRHIAWERERTIIGPVPLKTGVAYLDSARDRAVYLDLSQERPRTSTFQVGRRAIFAMPTPDRSHLAVITRGEEAVIEGQVNENPSLWLIDVDTPGSRPISYPIGSPFDRLAISEDGAIAVAYFSEGGADAEGFFRNPNELAIVHLNQPPSASNPTLKTVRSFGAAPDGVVLSPPMAIPGADDPTLRVFAFVLAPNNVTMLDATYPTRNEVSIRLDISDETVRPREMVFARNTATAYLRSDNARDILEILISPEPSGADDPLANDYRPALAELGAGAGPADIAVYDDASGRRLILAATPGTREVVVIDADTAEFSKFPTEDPVDRILLFSDGVDSVPKTAVLAGIGSQLSRLKVLDLEGITDDLVRVDMSTVSLSAPVLDVVAVPGQELAMVVHDDSRTVLGLLDVSVGSVAPLQGVGALDSYAFTPDGKYLVGATSGSDRVGFVDLANLHPSDVRLDDLPGRLLAMPNGKIFVDHGDPFGLATIIPSPTATRDEALVLTGFLLAGLFDEEF